MKEKDENCPRAVSCNCGSGDETEDFVFWKREKKDNAHEKCIKGADRHKKPEPDGGRSQLVVIEIGAYDEG